MGDLSILYYFNKYLKSLDRLIKQRTALKLEISNELRLDQLCDDETHPRISMAHCRYEVN